MDYSEICVVTCGQLSLPCWPASTKPHQKKLLCVFFHASQRIQAITIEEKTPAASQLLTSETGCIFFVVVVVVDVILVPKMKLIHLLN